MVKFCALCSGSSGNCTYIESGGAAILIDTGVSTKAIRQSLEAVGADIGKLRAIFITHEHSDHIKGLPVLTSKYPIPVYANAGTIRGILNESARVKAASKLTAANKLTTVSKLTAANKLTADKLSELETGTSIEIGDMVVSSFATSHDSLESVGYTIHTADGHSVAVATDLGHVSDSVMSAISSCELVMLESNHDVGMLQNGRYPYFLKRRILSDRGHLSNDSCASVLPALMEYGAKHFVLAHLSRENNLPELAIETAKCALNLAGARLDLDYTLEAAPRVGPGRLYEL